ALILRPDDVDFEPEASESASERDARFRRWDFLEDFSSEFDFFFTLITELEEAMSESESANCGWTAFLDFRVLQTSSSSDSSSALLSELEEEESELSESGS